MDTRSESSTIAFSLIIVVQFNKLYLESTGVTPSIYCSASMRSGSFVYETAALSVTRKIPCYFFLSVFVSLPLRRARCWDAFISLNSLTRFIIRC